MKTGTVLYGINNIFYVQTDTRTIECRIKGKTLKEAEGEHNPLAPGDMVVFEENFHHENSGQISRRLPRENSFSRWNRKKKRVQTIAVNLDLIVCVSSVSNPPFRPRFIDRVIIEAERAEIPVAVVINKDDLPSDNETDRRIDCFTVMGYPVFRCSAVTGKGTEELNKYLSGKRTVFMGQSGVGKSTLLNRLFPGLSLRTGAISRKHDRGSHTTVYSLMIPMEKGSVIDTPGIREFELRGIDSYELSSFFRDFRPFSAKCRLRNCRHLNEPECAVRKALEEGMIHPDRYESYCNILAAVEELPRYEQR